MKSWSRLNLGWKVIFAAVTIEIAVVLGLKVLDTYSPIPEGVDLFNYLDGRSSLQGEPGERTAGKKGLPLLNSEYERHDRQVPPELELTREIRLAKGNPMDGTSESGGLRTARKGQQYALNRSLPVVDPISGPVEPGAQSVTPLSEGNLDVKVVKYASPQCIEIRSCLKLERRAREGGVDSYCSAVASRAEELI